MLIGNATRDPETRTTPNGQTVSSFGIATTRVWTDQAGTRQEKTEFHQIVAWGKLAEICGQYLAKGRKAYIEGRLQTRDWTGEDGVKRYRTEIIAENVIFLDRAGAQNANPTTAPATGLPAATANPTETLPDLPPANADEDFKVENIPF